MELRNQFMHNIACDSFEKALELLGDDRRKELLKFNTIGGEKSEQQYSNSFLCLSGDSLRIILNKISLKEKDIEEKSAYIKRLLDFITEYDNMIHEKFDALMDDFEPNDHAQNKVEFEKNRMRLLLHINVLELKQEFIAKFGDFVESIHSESEDIANRILKEPQ